MNAQRTDMTGPKPKRCDSKHMKRPTPKPATASFRCFQCGAEVGADADRCPNCRSFYIRGLKEEDVDELRRAEEMFDDPLVDFVEAHGSSVIDFDADIAIMSLLDDDRTDPGFVSECSHCGTVVELMTATCPMCGTPLEHLSVGLVDIFADMEFDPEPFLDADCPYCGEHVTLTSGNCPSCGEAVDVRDERDPTLKVRPVLRTKDVVFLHLDIETGEINVLKRNGVGHGYDQVFLHLNGAGNDGLGKGRPGPLRG